MHMTTAVLVEVLKLHKVCRVHQTILKVEVELGGSSHRELAPTLFQESLLSSFNLLRD